MNQRLLGILYGHGNRGGPIHNYFGHVETGNLPTPEITHAVSGKDYNTLGKVMYSMDISSPAAQRTIENLRGRGIEIKTLGRTDQRALPGFQKGKREGLFDTVDGWARHSKEQYKDEVWNRLNAAGEPIGG